MKNLKQIGVLSAGSLDRMGHIKKIIGRADEGIGFGIVAAGSIDKI